MLLLVVVMMMVVSIADRVAAVHIVIGM